MVRSKQSLKLIPNEKTRLSTFLTRKNGLKKKINELSILCDVDVCMLIYGPSADGKIHPVVYPENSDNFHRIVQRYQSMDKDDRGKRSLTVSDFYDDQMKNIEDEVTKLTKKNDQDFEKFIRDDCLNNLTVDQLHQIINKLDFKIDLLETKKDMMTMKGNYGYSSVVPNQNPADIPSTSHGINMSKRDDTMYMQPYCNGEPFDQYHQQIMPTDYPSYDNSSMMYDNNLVTMNLMSSFNCYDGMNFIDNGLDFSYPKVQNQLPYDEKIITTMGNNMEFGNSTISLSYNLQASMVPPIDSKFPNMMVHGDGEPLSPELSTNQMVQNQSTFSRLN